MLTHFVEEFAISSGRQELNLTVAETTQPPNINTRIVMMKSIAAVNAT
jgi:hypothetical protein